MWSVGKLADLLLLCDVFRIVSIDRREVGKLWDCVLLQAPVGLGGSPETAGSWHDAGCHHARVSLLERLLRLLNDREDMC